MTDSCPKLEKKEKTKDRLFLECLEKAEGDKIRAHAIYNHIKTNHRQQGDEDLDQREKWPMLAPLLTLYTLGTIGVLALVFGFLANKLNWW